MKLRAIGFDHWFENHMRKMEYRETDVARVSAVDRGGSCLIRNDHGEIPAEISGKMHFQIESRTDLPCVGDWVAVQYHSDDTAAIIHRVLPRRTLLRRKTAGTDVDVQMIATNIDTAFIIQSCHFDFNLKRMDRYLVMAADGGVEPVIVLTKTDLVTPDEQEQMQAAILRNTPDIPVIALSNKTGAGFDRFMQGLRPGKTYCLLGSSGVGKTTIMNRLLGDGRLTTKDVSATGEGTHTTTRRQLILLDQGALFIDTPGMRELGLLGTGSGLDQGFADIRELAAHCRYSDCSHTREPGCAILEALENGRLQEDRYLSYTKLKKESEFHELSYVEKRKKDKSFAKMVRATMKGKHKQ